MSKTNYYPPKPTSPYPQKETLDTYIDLENGERTEIPEAANFGITSRGSYTNAEILKAGQINAR